MMRIFSPFLIVLFLLAATPLNAQFRSAMRKANKEYDIHAYNLAINSYQEALARRSTDLEALSKIANSYRMLNQMSQAHQYYTQAVRNRKVSPDTKLQHAHVLKALGRYDEAKQWYLAFARDHDAVVGNHFAQSCDFAKQQAAQNSGFRATASPANSPTAEFGPSYAGQNQLLFSSARTDKGGAFDGQAHNHPFVSTFGAGGTLQEPFLLRNGYDAGNVGPVNYSPDGSKVVFTRNNFTDGTRMIPAAGMSLTLWIADVNPSGQWVNARPLPFNGSDFSSGFGMFSSDGLSIYFASNRPEGYGGYDIYRSTWGGNDWSTIPENLGTVINSVGDEITPYFDGTNLYFSSNWHHGLGGFDVFRTEMPNGRPNTLYHMGNGINSSRDDYGFIYDVARNAGFVVSNRIGGSGNEDLYRINLAGQNLTIIVRSASDGTAVSGAIIDFTACGDQAYSADFNGRYVFQAVSGLNCEVTITKDGYVPVTLPMQSLTNAPGGEIPVSLSKLSESYRGKIVNAQTRLPVAGAIVRLVNRGSGNVAEVTADVNGDYAVAMQPYNTYDITISAPGYESINFPLAMADGSDRNVLSTLSLLPSQGTVGPPITGGGGNPYTPPANTGGGVTTSGFSVQMASVSKAPDMNSFGSLSDLGRVYAVNAGGAYKIRMGVFQTRAEAESAKAALAQRGYPGSFIVTDTGDGTGVRSGQPNPAPPTTTGPPTTTPNNNFGVGPYYVQLGAYKNPRYFDTGKAQQIGNLVQRSRGDLTLMLIDAGSNVATARTLQSRAKNSGYPKAFVVQDVNGQLVKVGG
ncbi:MAG: carboxypeptidase regulatory-like domain-containing protein [Bacteroidota bacterium]